MLAVSDQIGRRFLELRSDAGRLYVLPSRWQRVYLRWMFRHFRVLPRQVLNQHQQQLIKELCRSPVPTTAEKASRAGILGVVENVILPSQFHAGQMAQADRKTTKPVATQARTAAMRGLSGSERLFVACCCPGSVPIAVGSAAVGVHPVSGNSPATRLGGKMEMRKSVHHLGGRVLAKAHRNGFWAFGVTCAATVLVGIVFHVRPITIAPRAKLSQIQLPLETPVPNKAKLQSSSVLPEPIPLAEQVKPKPPAVTLALASSFTPQKPSPNRGGDYAQRVEYRGTTTIAGLVAASAPSQSERPRITSSPQIGFAYPVAPDPTLIGRVSLRVIVGADGLVKDVDVLSGDRTLAWAAVRAVRRWHYSPFQVRGRTVEAETNITVNFVGGDAVSIISWSVH